jgi:hypothetical protein
MKFNEKYGGIIVTNSNNEIGSIKKNIRIIAEKLGLQFESFRTGNYLLKEPKNKIDMLLERIEGIERSLYKIEKIIKADDYEFITETKLIKKDKSK